jgi:putative DNA primase/helicase
MFSSDAFLLSQLAGCGTQIPGPGYDVSRASPAFRPLAERLLAASIDERQAIWNDFLAARIGGASAGAAPGEAKLPPESQSGIVPRSLAQRVAGAVGPGTEPADPHAQVGVRMTRADQFEPRSVEWLWADRVPLGMITMFAGGPKLGKSFVTLAMAAAVSRGLALPQSDRPSAPASTILMSAEDDPSRTIAPRLLAAGADLSKIHVIESVILANGSETLPSLRVDVEAISAAAARLGDCRLIVVDPVPAYLKGVDDNRNAVLRGVLSPLKSLAERLRAAVVLVNHLTKSAAGDGKNRVLGSIAYVGACRANFLFLPDPRDPAGRRVLMFDNGGNTAPLALPLAYTIEDQGGQGAQVLWSDAPATISLEEALWPRGELPERHGNPELSECEGWLKETLGGGRVLAADLRRACQEAGFTWRTLHRARSRIGAMTRREGFGRGSKVVWQLRDSPPHGASSEMDAALPP